MSFIKEARTIVGELKEKAPDAVQQGSTSELEKEYRGRIVRLTMEMALSQPKSCLGEEADTLLSQACQLLLMPVILGTGANASERDLFNIVATTCLITRTLFDELLAEQMNLPEEDLRTEGQ